MRTKEEVLEHLKKVAYSHEAMERLMGFLVGAGLKTNDEKLYVVYGASTFEDFLSWYNNDEEMACNGYDCVLCSIINDISKRLENATDDDEAAYYAEQLAFLLDAFDLIDDEE